ncbi:MAG: Holliday junction resolvase RuvX [Turneriella sp.]
MPAASVRVLCIDYGSRFIGIAVADFPGITARALETIRTDRTPVIPAIAKILETEKVQKLLLGFPFSDVEGEIHRQIHAFRHELSEAFPGMSIEYVDESYSSQEADALVSEAGLGRKKKIRAQDSEAAKIVLLRYLNAGQDTF